MGNRNPYRRTTTKPLPRAELAPPASAPRADEEGEITKVQCPSCAGAGMLPADIAAAVARALAAESERR